MTRRRAPHRVATVVDHRVSMFELAVPCEVFGIDRPELHDPWYSHVVCAPHPGDLETGQGAVLRTTHGLDDVVTADTVVVVPPLMAGPDPQARPETIEALREAYGRGARMLSLCTGAFVLAEAGLLDGRPATTHWMHATEMARRYPKVRVDPRVLYIDDGQVLTSAGTAAGIDLCLHVVRCDLGAEVANAVARRMVVPPHRDGGQAQFVDLPVASSASDDPIGMALGWMLERLDRAITVEQAAHRVGMSPRHFARRFREVTGTTPLQWLLSQRVLLAQRLLETTDLSIEVVATRCGFGSAAGLRSHFQRAVSASPVSYRRTFRQATA
ncbi:MAG TPA: helix-turn-helix domain-containing protein [Acidimicrobiales bacterium]|nr:helix-turn-helix domain-containing protein [Acidimicrobiales bacterium]